MSKPITSTVAITGMNATDNPAPGVAVARALRASPEFQGKIVGLGYDALDPGFYMNGLLDAGAVLPYPSAGKTAMKRRFEELRAELGIDVLLPTLDSELRALISLEDDLAALGIKTWLPDMAALERTAKPQLPKLGKSKGVRTPDAEAITTVAALPALGAKFGYPIVVKGPYYGAEVAYTERDAVTSFYKLSAIWGFPITVQKFVGGEEYNVAGIGDGGGGLVGAVAMKKMALTDKGKGLAGVTVNEPRLIELGRDVVSALKWRGPFELEVIVERKTDELHLIEINPRFPAWIFLSVGAGQNLPLAHLKLALGQPLTTPLPAYQAGTVFVRISLDQITDLETFARLSVQGVLPAAPPADPNKTLTPELRTRPLEESR